jgi:hypothetical protein
MEQIDLNLDEENELIFSVVVEGTSDMPEIARFICESDNGIGFSFTGKVTESGISVVIPSMKGKLSEGKTYNSRLELVIGGKYFAPLKAKAVFKENIKIESVSVVHKNKLQEEKIVPQTRLISKKTQSSSTPTRVEKLSNETSLKSIIKKMG